ncbi:MAG: glutamate racemase [Firmicutes bacterium]|nr:glutamate racemase [Bacillota bacterium]MBQ3122532.1 glutamate racemase [Bacillota bacterium]MBQ9973163.1 glutamate racemase [Bacillota bacterium]
MDNRPIGFFDSGLGGLTCIPHLTKALPEEKIIYFGDTARTPYGSKATSTIRNFSLQIADFLVQNDVKMIVIACNTVSATCLEDLQMRFPEIPVVGIIKPAVQRVAESCNEENRVGIIGTKVTIRSEQYKSLILNLRNDLNIYSTPCPAFVPLIEEGIIKNEIMDMCIKYYLDDFINDNKIDTLVLGCTHYPLIRDNIEKIYPELRIIDPSEEIINSIRTILEERDMFADNSEAENVFYASDLSENFTNMINTIFDSPNAKVMFKNLDIESAKALTEE